MRTAFREHLEHWRGSPKEMAECRDATFSGVIPFQSQ
jgi:hypothetical protein